MRIDGRQVEMLFDPAHARLEFGNQDAVADDGSVIFDDGAAQRDDLVAQFLAGFLVLGLQGRDVGCPRLPAVNGYPT
ncbi:hypothetical protein ACSBOB_03915 [Mesorhizobium sp. ASY16-5R]|uniref:hypothetical protein n=1 Tax=Mesorhizobium sp. ASY16-5R TaxID=3445772 RepID=UPI003FA1362C